MTTLTVNINDQGAERKVRALLDKLGSTYAVNADNTMYNWWKDVSIVNI